MKWISVNRSHPCPICGKPDWCGINDEGTMCICMRASNDYPSKNGGYIYIFEEGTWKSPYKRVLGFGGYNLPSQPLTPSNFARKWHYKAKLTPKEITDFIVKDAIFTLDNWDYGVEDICGVCSFLEIGTAIAFGCFQSKSHPDCLGIPLRNAGGDFVGIRFRNIKTHEKTSLLGGSDGLFFSGKIYKHKVNTLFIVEGATDAIALGALGFDVVGRSSCATGTDHIRELLNILKPSNLVYVADNDNAKLIADKYREAGREGARKLANDIGRPYKMITPLTTKDIRSYILNHRLKGAETGQIRVYIERMVNNSRIQFKAK